MNLQKKNDSILRGIDALTNLLFSFVIYAAGSILFETVSSFYRFIILFVCLVINFEYKSRAW